MKRIIFGATAILFFILLIEWWVLYFSSLNVPEYIPYTSVNINGLFLGLTLLLTFVFLDKKLLSSHPSTSISKLTFIGVLVCFLAELLFQIVRIPTLQANSFDEQLKYLIRGVVGVTLIGAVISFMVAFQIKKKQTGILLIMIVVFLILFQLLKVN